MDTQQLQEQLESDEPEDLLEAFSALLSGKRAQAMDRKTTERLIPLCVSKLNHEEIAVRAGGCEVIADQLKAENSHLNPFLVTVAKSLALPENLDLTQGKEDKRSHWRFHKYSCDIITEMQFRKPEALMPSFRPLGQYLVSCTATRNRRIATAACNYWARLQVPPVASPLMEAWLGAVLNKLGKLVPSLLKSMVYTEDHLRYLETDNQESRKADDELPEELEEHTNQRNFAALGFENICRIFQNEVIIIFRPLIPKWMNSDDWLQVEAMILAVGAFTKAVGTPREMNEVYQDLIPHLLEHYSHPEPLVRSITCFAMQQFINVNIKGIKDPFSKMLKCTMALIPDPNREVQEMALNSLSAMLAFATRDITPFSKKIIADLSQLDSCIKGKARFTYYECISHVFGRLGVLLSEDDAKLLMTPLMNEWQALKWDFTQPAEESKEGMFLLCQSLCIIATFTKTRFAPYNEEIFRKAVPFLRAMATGSGNPDLTAQHMVAYLDVLSAIFEGQSKDVAKMAKHHKTLEVTLDILGNTALHEKVHQSALALLGQLCTHCFQIVNPSLDKILDILKREMSKEMIGVKNNALWTLCPVIINSTESNTQLMHFAGPLQKTVIMTDLDQGTAINAALALTHLAKKYEDTLAETILKDELFSVLCGLLQQQLPRDLEKVAIFKNLCSIIAPDVQQLTRDGCVQLCMAAAVLDSYDPELNRSLASLLRDLRASVGNNGWNKITQQIGNQMAYALRKRYKLY